MARISTTIEHEGMTIDVSVEFSTPDVDDIRSADDAIISRTDPGLGPIAERVAAAAIRAGGFNQA